MKIISFLIFVFIFTGGFFIDAKSDDTIGKYDITRKIQYSFTLQNKTNSVVKKTEFWTYAPVKKTSFQYCENIEASYPFKLINDEVGNQILYFVLNNISPYGTKIITIKANMKLSPNPIPNPLQDGKPYIIPEKYIESENPDISNLARKLSSNSTERTTLTIFNWVSNNIRDSGYTKSERGALYTLKNMHGDCTESADLFIALCRANKIPARLVGGYICDENKILKPYDYHNWAEFYNDGTWNVSDPSNSVFKKKSTSYIVFKINARTRERSNNFNRFKLIGKGVEVKIND